jgi:ABC-type multidrug transport system permease subunit
LILEQSDAVKLLALMFGLVAFMLWFMSGMFCYGQGGLSCRLWAIRELLFSPYSFLPLIFGALILIVVVAVLLSVKRKK